MPAIAGDISGKNYGLDGGPDGIASLRLTFGRGSDATIDLRRDNRVEHLVLGLDNTYRLNQLDGQQVAVRGKWTDDHTFVVETQVLGAADRFEYTLSFVGTSVTGTIAARIESHRVPFQGHQDAGAEHLTG